jgi:regulatory protein
MSDSENDLESSRQVRATAIQQALTRLNVREYGAREMKNYLRRKAYGPEEIDAAVEALVQKGLISDERFSRIIARHSAQRGKGPGYIRTKLHQKGVKLEAAQAKKLFDELSPESELDLARRLLASKYPRAFENMKEKQRAYQGLIRRGLSHDIVRECFKNPVREDEIEAQD